MSDRASASTSRPSPPPPPVPDGVSAVVDRHRRMGELSGEFAGCLVMMVIGLGAEAAVLTGGGHFGDFLVITLGWGLGVTCAVYVSARLSGPHLNPALTIGLAVCGKFPWRKVLPFTMAQLAGGFAAALIVRAGYDELLLRYDPHTTIKSQLAFSTLPGNGLFPIGLTTAFFAELIATALLVFVICALITPANNPPLANLTPMLIGWLVVAVGMSWGANSGYAINPARDLGPRVVSLLTGYESALHDQNGNLYFWLPVVAPILGGVLGAGLFRVLIEQFLPTADLSVAPLSQYAPKSEDGSVAVRSRERLDGRRRAPDAPLFVYGSLQFADVLRALLGRVPRHAPVEVYGWRAAALPGVEYPGLVPAQPLNKVSGVILVGLEQADWEVLDAFEDPVYNLTLLTLVDGRQAWTYTCAESTSVLDSDWSAGSFADHYLPGYVNRCAVWRQQYTLGAALERRRTARRFCALPAGVPLDHDRARRAAPDHDRPRREPLRLRRQPGPHPARDVDPAGARPAPPLSTETTIVDRVGLG
ncbi:MAG TPA: MIP family channel protein [Pseudonocardia sp.]|nr:MIP family channel protein [Pseudonocardia sp.]